MTIILSGISFTFYNDGVEMYLQRVCDGLGDYCDTIRALDTAGFKREDMSMKKDVWSVSPIRVRAKMVAEMRERTL